MYHYAVHPSDMRGRWTLSCPVLKNFDLKHFNIGADSGDPFSVSDLDACTCGDADNWSREHQPNMPDLTTE